MDMNGEYRIAAPRDKVWAGLNDPETLRASIPGCESLEKTGDNSFTAKVVAKVGPVKAKFGGDVTLSNINAPESYTISGEGKGGAAGFAKGGADVKLVDDGEGGTILTYTAKADVGGKLAQLGSRLIDGTSKKMADEFFSNFREQVAPAEATPAAAAPVAAEASAEEDGEGLGALLKNKFVLVGIALVILMILVSLMR
ncbi:MAG: carbon monoxide dehydrogenase subunit G [Alphaproteobacteria bacterium]|nr:carbon monoxide dehydrogenase subunit G [Alphaproteobacteria bacterium]